MQVPFAQVLGPFAQKKAPGELPFLGGLAFWGDSLGERFTRLLPRAGPSLYNLSVSLRSTAPLVGEPLAKPFTLRGLPKPPLGRGGGTASAVTERFSPLRLTVRLSFIQPLSLLRRQLPL